MSDFEIEPVSVPRGGTGAATSEPGAVGQGAVGVTSEESALVEGLRKQPGLREEIRAEQASALEVKKRADLATITGDAQKLTFATAILGGATVDEAARAAQIRPETGRLWIKRDSEVKEVIIYAMEQAGVDPVEVVTFHKQVRDRAFERDELNVARLANVDLARMMGLNIDYRNKKKSDSGTGLMDKMMRLLDLVEAREVKGEVVQ